MSDINSRIEAAREEVRSEVGIVIVIHDREIQPPRCSSEPTMMTTTNYGIKSECLDGMGWDGMGWDE